ncbi:hypothetical protein [Microbacterium sp. LMI1x-1-1.1]|uniref:hypothetical protein n=1 Tax=Microbacterium sp. LMI1x-1-1.1 TaxID=3135246 RepID=UPI003445CBA8
MANSMTERDEGSEWLYWDPKPRRWRRVELLTVPAGNPKRIRIQHLDRDKAGAAEWAPASRCRVRWSERGEYLARVERWERVSEPSPPTHIGDIAATLLDRYVDADIAEFSTVVGVLLVRDAERLGAQCGVSPTFLTSDPAAFREQDGWVIPWSTADKVLRELCRTDPGPGLQLLEEQLRNQQAFDQLVEKEGPRWWQRIDELEPSDERLAASTRAWHEGRLAATRRVRLWLEDGSPAGLADAYLELRGMYADLAEAARDAIPRLGMDRTQISGRIAIRLRQLTDEPTPVVNVRGFRRSE